jgi:hypothetical protein
LKVDDQIGNDHIMDSRLGGDFISETEISV